MIRAVIFDLDGTLIETEKLKAHAYAKAAIELCPFDIAQDDVYQAYADFVGGSRKEVAIGLLERFNLSERASQRMAEFSASEPWQVFTRLRLQILDNLLGDKATLISHQRNKPIALVNTIREWHCHVALATMSQCQQVTRVLDALNLGDVFDFIATREDVEAPKPDPEIYFLVAEALHVPIKDCLILEDSPVGVRAGLTAGAEVIGISSDLTRNKLHQDQAIKSAHILDDPSQLQSTVEALMKMHNSQ